MRRNNIRRGPKLEGCAFANFGNSSGARSNRTSRVWSLQASDSLGGRIWILRLYSPHKSSTLSDFWLWSRPQKYFQIFFDTPNSTYQLTASEALEAGLKWPKTSALMSLGCMQSFNLLALKIRLLIAHISKRPRRPLRQASHILKTSAFMSWGCMQRFNLLTLKLRLLIVYISWRPRRLLRPASNGLKLAHSWVVAACKVSIW